VNLPLPDRSRLPLALGAVAAVAALTLSSCNSVQSDAARVDGDRIGMSDFEADLQALSDIEQLVSRPVETHGTVASENVRAWLNYEIQLAVEQKAIAAEGESVTADDRANAVAAFEQGFGEAWSSAPQRAKDLLVDLQATQYAFSRIATPSAAEIQQQYEEGPAKVGYACLRHIVVGTQAEADAAMSRLKNGEDFSTVAAAVSTDPGGSAQQGALLGANGEACIPLDTLAESFDAPVIEAVKTAKVGVPTDPVKTSQGYQILLVRPFDEVNDELVQAAQRAATTAELQRRLRESDVWVTSSIGEWSPASAQVTPIGGGLAGVLAGS
jgi:parvulin-like peptidyl-prolyl isomerase